MNTVIIVLMLIVCMMTWLKLSFLKWWQVLTASTAFATFIILSWPSAIQQSNNQIAEWLGNQQLMLDTAVVLTLEVVWQTAYCILAAWLTDGQPASRRTITVYRILRFMPGLLIFPVLYYLLIKVIYQMPGTDFAIVAWCMAAAVLITVPCMVYLLLKLLPEKTIRLEVLYLCTIMVLVLGIITTVNGTTSFKGSDPIEWPALLAFTLLAAVCTAAGFLIHKHNINKTTNRQSWN